MAEFLAIMATALAAVFLVPQIVRLVRTEDSAGISTTWAAFGFITNAVWVVYLARLEMWIAMAPPSIGVVGYGITLCVIATRSRDRAWVPASALYLASLALVTPLFGAPGVGAILTAAPLFQITPGVVAAYRTRAPTGISPLTWALLAGIGMSRGGYGWLAGDLALLGYGLVTCIGCLLILARWAATQGRTTGLAWRVLQRT